MPSLPAGIRGGGGSRGGILSYPSDRLSEEVAFLSYYLHWPRDQVMSLTHRERQHWVAEVSRLHERLNEASSPGR
ncbi:DUF6760 family protein [Pyxidicoccus sp. 3LFB2]